MAKKRKCRLTAEELAIHDEAVRLRKMTDKQLVDAFHGVMPEGMRKRGNGTANIEKLLVALENGECKGIKSALAQRIRKYAEELFASEEW